MGVAESPPISVRTGRGTRFRPPRVGEPENGPKNKFSIEKERKQNKERAPGAAPRAPIRQHRRGVISQKFTCISPRRRVLSISLHLFPRGVFKILSSKLRLFLFTQKAAQRTRLMSSRASSCVLLLPHYAVFAYPPLCGPPPPYPNSKHPTCHATFLTNAAEASLAVPRRGLRST